MDFSPDPKWALGYLRGRAKAFVAGRLPFAAVATAASLAEKHGVPVEQIRAVLQECGASLEEADGDDQ